MSRPSECGTLKLIKIKIIKDIGIKTKINSSRLEPHGKIITFKKI